MARKTDTIPGPRHNNATTKKGPHNLGAFRVYLPPAWLASWTHKCQPNYEDSLRNQSQPPVLYASSISLDHAEPKPKSDVRVNEIGNS